MESLQRARQIQKRQFDKKTKERKLEAGDKVLLLLPTDHNKILMHWKGPFQVIERVGLHDYHVEVNGKPKLFHINLFAVLYTEREARDVPAAAVIDTGEGDPEVEGEIPIPDFDQQESHEDVELCPQLNLSLIHI